MDELSHTLGHLEEANEALTRRVEAVEEDKKNGIFLLGEDLRKLTERVETLEKTKIAARASMRTLLFIGSLVSVPLGSVIGFVLHHFLKIAGV